MSSCVSSESAEEGDAGSYRCVATNIAGSLQADAALAIYSKNRPQGQSSIYGSTYQFHLLLETVQCLLQTLVNLQLNCVFIYLPHHFGQSYDLKTVATVAMPIIYIIVMICHAYFYSNTIVQSPVMSCNIYYCDDMPCIFLLKYNCTESSNIVQYILL